MFGKKIIIIDQKEFEEIGNGILRAICGFKVIEDDFSQNDGYKRFSSNCEEELRAVYNKYMKL